jgi:hypothetical protein
LAKEGEIASLSGAGDDPRYFQIRSLQTATLPPGKWQDEHRPLVDERGNVIGIVSAKVLAHGHQCVGGAAGLSSARSGIFPDRSGLSFAGSRSFSHDFASFS